MFKAMQTLIRFITRPTVMLGSLVLTVALFLCFPLVPIGGEMLDVRTGGYALDEAMAALDGYGAAGRSAYLVASVTLDTLFPLAYVTFLAGVIYRWRRTDRWAWLALAPVVAGLLDLGENLQVAGLLLSYPSVGAAQVAAASAFTVAKSIAFLAANAIAVSVAAIALVSRARRR